MIEIAQISDEQMTYDESILYCQFLEHNGHRDWRLPTFDEYIKETPGIVVVNGISIPVSCWFYNSMGWEDPKYVQPVRDL